PLPTLPPTLLQLKSLSPERSPPAHYTLSLHDALPISAAVRVVSRRRAIMHIFPSLAPTSWRGTTRIPVAITATGGAFRRQEVGRSEEHTSELQSPYDLVCRLLLEKKNACVPAHAPVLE